MTIALCINCGEIKSGALCPCQKCQTKSSGNIDLDIAFSDHHMHEETLKEFGDVIHVIHSNASDQVTRFWAFIHVVSEHYPSILKVDLESEMKVKVGEALQGVSLPVVTLR